jgi:tRNA C32,U32 (ribose-2'-O)-methylase TrmJ
MEEVRRAADRIDQATQDIQLLSAVLDKVDRNITAAAKRAVKRVGHWPLRLNSHKARERRDN